VPRHPSESSPSRLPLNLSSSLRSKLIHVSHVTYHGPNSEYHRLFNERFPPTQSQSQSSRPPSADPEAHEDEATWLANIIGSSTDAEGSWERVEPIESGALTVQFGDALGLDKKR
jgi:hypothetical protein